MIFKVFHTTYISHYSLETIKKVQITLHRICQQDG
jgi:hypothetical protein